MVTFGIVEEVGFGVVVNLFEQGLCVGIIVDHYYWADVFLRGIRRLKFCHRSKVKEVTVFGGEHDGFEFGGLLLLENALDCVFCIKATFPKFNHWMVLNN